MFRKKIAPGNQLSPNETIKLINFALLSKSNELPLPLDQFDLEACKSGRMKKVYKALTNDKQRDICFGVRAISPDIYRVGWMAVDPLLLNTISEYAFLVQLEGLQRKFSVTLHKLYLTNHFERIAFAKESQKKLHIMGLDILQEHKRLDFFSAEVSKELIRQNIYAVAIGSYIPGENFSEMDRERSNYIELYREAVKNLTYIWLFTALMRYSVSRNSREGFSLYDMWQNENYVVWRENNPPAKAAVVDYGSLQKMDFNSFINKINQDLLWECLGTMRWMPKGMELLSVIPEAIVEYEQKELIDADQLGFISEVKKILKNQNILA